MSPQSTNAWIAVPAKAGTHTHELRGKNRSVGGYGPGLSRGRQEWILQPPSASPRPRVNQAAPATKDGSDV